MIFPTQRIPQLLALLLLAHLPSTSAMRQTPDEREALSAHSIEQEEGIANSLREPMVVGIAIYSTPTTQYQYPNWPYNPLIYEWHEPLPNGLESAITVVRQAEKKQDRITTPSEQEDVGKAVVVDADEEREIMLDAGPLDEID